MTDIAYILGTIGFFALMVIYVRVLDKLGGREGTGKER
jgi:hypothetical protein